MTEVSEDATGNENHAKGAAPAVDGILQALVSTINQSGLEVGLTLATPAGLVTGTAIAPPTWLRALADEIGSIAGGAPAVIADEFRSTAARWDEMTTNTPDDGTGPHHVHLRDAQYLVGGSALPRPGHLWRGRLSEVSGWYLGIISAG